MKWVKIGANHQRSDKGHNAVRYRMAPRVLKWLLYQPSEPLEYGDYMTFDSLRELKKSVLFDAHV